MKYLIPLWLLLGGCSAVRTVVLVPPASFEADAVVVCVYKQQQKKLVCMTPEDAYLLLTETQK